jgi:NADPH:quinone reductase-like Zn-dependent oxidoreductase
MTDASTMLAAMIEAHGADFRVVSLPRPVAGPGQVLVRVRAAGINPLDTKIRAGAAPHARQQLPAVLGIDLAGIVVAVGEGVSAFRAGDEVYGMVGGVGGHQGTLAEYAAVDAALLALKPANLSMRQAAVLPLVVITAWEGLVDRARVSSEHSVLIHGGAGGVGHVAIQIARHFGARVFATGSETSREAIEKFGVIFIDYRAEPAADYVARLTAGHGFDVIYDTAGGATLDASFAAVRRFGHVVSCLGWGTHALGPLSFRAATYSGVFTLLPLLTGEGRARHGEILAQAGELALAGELVPNLDARTFTLRDVGEAFRVVAEGAARGKVCVDIDG